MLSLAGEFFRRDWIGRLEIGDLRGEGAGLYRRGGREGAEKAIPRHRRKGPVRQVGPAAKGGCIASRCRRGVRPHRIIFPEKKVGHAVCFRGLVAVKW